MCGKVDGLIRQVTRISIIAGRMPPRDFMVALLNMELTEDVV